MRRRSTGTTLLLGLALLGQLSGSVHFLLVRHGRCAEHGDVVELGAHEHAGASTSGADRRVALTAPRSGAPQGEHDHEHCLAAGHRSDTVSPARAGASPVRLATTVRAPSAALDPIASPIPLVLLAPKSSPPAA